MSTTPILTSVFHLGAAVIQLSANLFTTQSITALTTSQINYFNPYTYYASAAYCPSALTLAWDCGASCAANPNFKPVASGGDGVSVQLWYVGYDPSLDSVIVAHQGTDPVVMESLATDADLFLTNLNTTLFPGISSEIECHNGFVDQQALTATDVLTAVNETMLQYGTTNVTLVGHSLGAAITLLDSVYLPLWLPNGTTFQTIGYGLPRVGNQAFADYVDANLNLTHINNEADLIPIVPGMSVGFVHPAGEVHIASSGEWDACPGQDNPSIQCIVGNVPFIEDGNLVNHLGPYNGIYFPGCLIQF